MQEEYKVRLSQFEGPLDLLLHLIQSAKIALEDIFISQVTEQYLEYMKQIDEVDMSKTSSFLSMASTLLYIKSKSLLPENNFVEEEEEDPRQALIEKLRAYKAYKDVCEELRKMEEEADNIYYKLPEEIPDIVAPVEWEDARVSDLYEAFLKVLTKKKADKDVYKTVDVKRDSFSVREQTKKIYSLLAKKKRFSFFELFEDTHIPMEIAVTFMALLEMLHLNKLKFEQKQNFGDIILMSA